MKLQIGGRKVFGTVEEERAGKMASLTSDAVVSERLFLDALGAARLPGPIETALEFAKSLDFSKSSLRSSYLSHPLRVATFLLKIAPRSSADHVITALLHNVPETTDVKHDELERRFGKTAADGIRALCVDRAAQAAGKDAYLDGYYRRIHAAGDTVALIKLLDKMDNLFVLCLNPDDAVRADYMVEIRARLLPFAVRLDAGLGAYLSELVDDAEHAGFSADLKSRLEAHLRSQKSGGVS
jgi:(p)ppGpp synthase/HD superfamily hydrolase